MAKSLSEKSWKRVGHITIIPYSSAFICVAYGKPLRVYICGLKSLKSTFRISSNG